MADENTCLFAPQVRRVAEQTSSSGAVASLTLAPEHEPSIIKDVGHALAYDWR